MDTSGQFLGPSTAAKRLGVSTKALRLYERFGLLTPPRTAAGWRVYGPADMAQAETIVALRSVGLGLAQIARVLRGDGNDLAPALAGHQAVLEARIRDLGTAMRRTHHLLARLAHGNAPDLGAVQRPGPAMDETGVAFDLPWPWGGERFALNDVGRLNYIVGPLGSGKTRLAQEIARALPDAAFLGLDRAENDAAAARAQIEVDPRLRARVSAALHRLMAEGATASAALTALIVALEAEAPSTLVVDMIEQGLDRTTQVAVIAHLRRRRPAGRSLFMLTRSNAILDLATVGPDEAIILCPANHSPPVWVECYWGAPGYEAVATCLASPTVRARTEGVIAWRPDAA